MSLIVLDPDIADAESLGSRLCKQLTELGLHTIETPDSRVAADLASSGSVEMIICCHRPVLEALPAISPSVALAWVTDAELTSDDLLTAMRRDVHDVWSWPDVEEELQERVTGLQDRVRSWSTAMSNEVSTLRTELERDQRAGQYIQMGMLPPNPMGIGHFKLQHRVQPSLILSGDFVDYFQISDRYFACYVADVAGHGASSAFITVLLKNFSRRLRREYRVSMLSNPGEILQWINGELIDQGIDKHVAIFFAIVDMRKEVMHFANAAHLPPAALVVDGELQSLEQSAKPLGLFPNIQFESLTVDFPKGAKLVVFSDGVLDLVPEDSIAAKEQHLAQVIRTAETMDDLWDTLSANHMGPDDVSCLMVRYE
ncbi:MAG: PP2C family protein-serine/threonine phosphatase [Pseudomonadales bacterium]